MDAAESDGDQQLNPLLTDDAPEKTFSVINSSKYAVCLFQWKPSSHVTLCNISWTDMTYSIRLKIMFNYITLQGAGRCEETDPNLMVGE